MTTDSTGHAEKPDAPTVSVPSITLQPNDDKLAMPVVGLGTWKAPAGVVGDVVAEAIQSGYRCIDCACDYGNEREVGNGIRRGLQATPGLQRKDLFVTSKLWNTYHREEHVRPALQRTLSDLDLDYLDLYLIHFPISLKYVPFDVRYPPEWIHDPEGDSKTNTLVPEYVSVHETWRAMEKLVDDGLVRHIGVSNFPAILIMELLSTARIKPAVLQVELHPYLQQTKLLEFCQRNDIVVTAFSPLGASSYRSLGMDKGHDLLGEQTLIDLAHQHGKTPAQIALKWAVQRGTAVIPKTSRVERLAENMALFDGSEDGSAGSNGWQLSEEDMAQIAALDRKVRYNDPGEFCVGMGMSIPIHD